jgi:hypothetical protein
MIYTRSPQTEDSIVSRGLDYITSHFLHQEIWPRNISTKATGGCQIVANSRNEAIERFKESNFQDCRISAYPLDPTDNPSAIEKYQGLSTITPRNIVVMIDLDRNNFTTDRAFEMSLTRTLNNIKNKFTLDSDSNPSLMVSIIWSGNGYHVYLVLDSEGINLEYIKDFTDLESGNISRKFLRFTECFLSDNKSDKRHNTTVSFHNTMMRIPGSVNSKNNSGVRIMRRWDFAPAHHRIPASIKPLLKDFRRYLIDENIKRKITERKKKLMRKHMHQDNIGGNQIAWIERLLQTPLSDSRKYCIWRILTPYLINIKGLSDRETMMVISEWLGQCGKLRKLDFNPRYKIREGINGARETSYLPISRDKLNGEHEKLYFELFDN